MASVTKRPHIRADGTNGDKWMVRYVDPSTGRRLGKSFDLKKDADTFRRKVEREIEQGTHISDELAISVKEVCERYYASCEAREKRGEIGETRLVQVRIMIDKHIVPRLGVKQFRHLKTSDVDQLYDSLSETVSAFYARLITSNLGTMERWAARQGYIHVSPVSNALRGIRVVKRPRIEAFSQDQIGKILRYVLDRTAPRKRYGALVACYIHLASCCGLRVGEISALDRNSIDLERKRLRIRRNITSLRKLKGPKSDAGNRDIPIPDHLCEMLRNWLNNYYLPSDDDYVFTTYAGKPVMQDNIRYGWHYVLKKCDLYREGAVFHFHALRHFSGSWWLENGMPIQDVALQLGHANASTTLQIYAHTVSKVAARQAAMTHMGGLLIGSSATPVTHEAVISQ